MFIAEPPAEGEIRSVAPAIELAALAAGSEHGQGLHAPTVLLHCAAFCPLLRCRCSLPRGQVLWKLSLPVHEWSAPSWTRILAVKGEHCLLFGQCSWLCACLIR